MRVKIIKNSSLIPNGPGSIEEFIGGTYDVSSMGTNGSVNIFFEGRGTMTIYPTEYEVVDIAKELSSFIKQQRPYGVFSEDIKDFILEHRTKLMSILK